MVQYVIFKQCDTRFRRVIGKVYLAHAIIILYKCICTHIHLGSVSGKSLSDPQVIPDKMKMHCVFFYMCCSLSIFISLLSKWGGWALIYYYLTLYWQLYWHSLPAVRIKSWQPLFKDRNKNTLQSRKYVYPYKKKNERRCFSKTASATGFPDKFGIGNLCERSELRLQKLHSSTKNVFRFIKLLLSHFF